MGVLWRVDVWSAEVRLMFQRNRHSHRSWTATAEHMDLLDVLLQQRIETQIHAEIGISQAYVIFVLNDHIPTHKAHLKSKDCWVFTIIR
jgi:hypothetical protein